MALSSSFYQEIFKNENSWIESLQSNLLNVYYLPELQKLYNKQKKNVDSE